MNVKEYIASGVVESYVMGLASEAERLELEALSKQYPEIAEAKRAFEAALEEQLLQDSIRAPQHLKQQIQEKLSSANFEAGTDEFEEETTPVRRIGIWKWLAAASLVLMAGSIYWALSTNKKYQDSLARNEDLEKQVQQFSNELAGLKPGTGSQPVSDFKMATIKEGSEASVSIYWDTVSKDVYLMINNMPQPPSDKQYQLWALLPEEGAAPVNLGMIELKQERLLSRMKNVKNAKAFAITLEPRNGSTTPTGTPMISSQPVNL